MNQSFLIFILKNQSFALPLSSIVSVNDAKIIDQTLARFPAPKHVRGMVNVYGRIIQAWDLGLHLFDESYPNAQSAYVIIKSENTEVALLVDEIKNVYAPKAGEIKTASGTDSTFILTNGIITSIMAPEDVLKHFLVKYPKAS